jgi:hypothetical protein
MRVRHMTRGVTGRVVVLRLERSDGLGATDAVATVLVGVAEREGVGWLWSHATPGRRGI